MNIGFIDYYLDEWHANNYPRWIEEASGGAAKVSKAYGMIDSPIGGRTTRQWCEDMGIPQAQTIAEIVETCDAIIVLSPDNCEMHEELSQLPLRSGKPTYIDKTFAPDYETAKRIFALAEQFHTPCYSTSALRYADEYQAVTGVDAAYSWGPYGFETYSIHQLEPVVMLIGATPERVLAVKTPHSYSLQIEFEGGKVASVTGVDGEVPFMINVVRGASAQVIAPESDYFKTFIRAMLNFFVNPAEVVPHAETLRIMALRTAGIEALKRPGEWVNVVLS
ncbi:MAG: hypothetical protein IJ074_12135 [Clostridia bacterium]|nr:hypothetical protein [Clostridia bacterium]